MASIVAPSWFRRLAVILRFVGALLMAFSVTLLPPILVSLWYGDGATRAFADALVLALAAGFVCWFPNRRARREPHLREGFAVVLLFWGLVPLVGAVPFVFSEQPHMHFVNAVFEAASGLTTTGATVLSGLDHMPHAILFYRAELNFLGGMGIVVLAVALLPMLHIGGMQLYVAETPGPMKEKKLAPRVRDTARTLWKVYVGLNVACTLGYWTAGMSLFDAICHSFATLALGGFSNYDANLGHFQSPAIEIVAGAFSMAAGINMALHFLAWRSKSTDAYLREPEFRAYGAFIAGLVVVTCVYLYLSETFPFWQSVYHGFFQAISVATDNGLVTVGCPAQWPAFIVVLLVVASFVGGCAGSTCGGIKAFRFLVMFKQAARELRLLVHPSAEIAIKVGHHTVPDRVIQAVWGLVFVYVSMYVLLSLLLMVLGLDPVTAFGSVAGCMNNMGVGLGQTAVSFEGLGDAAKTLLVFAMLVGRFEVLPFLLLLTRDFWRA